MRDIGTSVCANVRQLQWTELCNCICETFRFSAKEKEAFQKNQTAKLIAALPFAAECDDAKRTALAHLAIYVTELRGGAVIGDHTPADNESVYARLRLLSSFKGGKKSVIDQGMSLLALTMIRGYEKSKSYDAQHHIYNPLNDGSWNFESMERDLLSSIGSNPSSALREFVQNPAEAWESTDTEN
ncbi:hypothetical protein [Treponema brennaborense]|uniref:Uncharacterized protein n=1 Tax=Treponema brennaborense (strain DSM 12168 / CIP 105900 / DD5/3) TaxID=906968 RepID=F4LNR6_TREBD|nr:hypothetical protein [Treponema brennaborense]AEE16901.1 hypothetical protein Trebr_1477 [Treponema brennaborense DSM 12168]